MLMAFALPCLSCSGKGFLERAFMQAPTNCAMRLAGRPLHSKDTAPSAKGSTTCVSALTVFYYCPDCREACEFLWHQPWPLRPNVPLFIDADARWRLRPAAWSLPGRRRWIENRRRPLQSAVIAACSASFRASDGSSSSTGNHLHALFQRMESRASPTWVKTHPFGSTKSPDLPHNIGGTIPSK